MEAKRDEIMKINKTLTFKNFNVVLNFVARQKYS